MLSTGYDFFTAAEIVGVYRDVQNDWDSSSPPVLSELGGPSQVEKGIELIEKSEDSWYLPLHRALILLCLSFRRFAWTLRAILHHFLICDLSFPV